MCETRTRTKILKKRIRNPSMKQGSLLCHILVSLESSGWVRVHWLGLRLFEAMVWKLLIIEPFSQWKLNKIKTENGIGILGLFLTLLESPRWVRFDKVYFTIFRVNVWEILIFERNLLLEIQTDCQIWV
jgi:hypothetical protein